MISILSELQWLIDRHKIIEMIVGMANAMDEQNWQRLRTYLADEINVDYSDFRGESPQKIAADLYVQQRITGLTGLKTLHISTNHEVTIQPEEARCRSAYRIYRIDPTAESGQERLDTAGTYHHQLMQMEGEWKVTAIRQTLVGSNAKLWG
ncbi:MAG: nuclear transport factor 2 family protein [Oculatellaceae cyanobacterium Prado106]|nr:nuclear transport factor 2 family protein [Oculatellaceae cyanobacterium Prado106]